MRSFVFAILLSLSALSGTVQAGPSAYVLASAEKLSLEQAVNKLHSRVGGRVLGARVVQHEDISVYEIKILVKPGKVRVYRVDPYSGKIL